MRQRPAFSSLGSVRGIGWLRPAAGACGEGEAMALTLHVCPGDSSAVVWVIGDVDTNAAEVFRDMMLRVMRRHSPSLLLDLSGVSFMDCAGLRALLLTRRLAGMRGVTVLRADRVKISPVDDRPAYVQIDGELGGKLPAEIRIVPNALTLLAPPEYGG